jgi:hypothetical protein
VAESQLLAALLAPPQRSLPPLQRGAIVGPRSTRGTRHRCRHSTCRVKRSVPAVDALLRFAQADPSATRRSICAQSVRYTAPCLCAAVYWSQTHLKTGLRRARLRCALGGRGLATLTTLAAANLATCKRARMDTKRTRLSHRGLALSIARCETATDAELWSTRCSGCDTAAACHARGSPALRSCTHPCLPCRTAASERGGGERRESG